MQALLDAQDFAFKEIKRGDTLTGTIVRIEANEILVDIGSKSEGVINVREIEGIPSDVLAELHVGDTVQTVVLAPEDRNGHVVLSLSRGHTDRDWKDAEALFQSQDVFEGVVAGHNKGGLIVKIGKVRGFVPASQLVSGRARGEGGESSQEGSKENRWAAMTGQKLQLKVIELDRQRNRLILSERAAMRDWRKTQKEKLLSELKEGDIREGKVISLADFGAFIDLGGADGLVHLSELSWKRVNHPREVLKVGQKVQAQIINIDPERKRIGLSLKRLEADPWSAVGQRYKIGQLVEGTITKLAKFGAFARVKGDEEIEGLIHVSELSEGRVNHPKEVVHEGQLVTLRIIRIDSQERRLGLSLKRVAKGEYADSDWQQHLADADQAESEMPPEAVADDMTPVSAEPQAALPEPEPDDTTTVHTGSEAVPPEAEPNHATAASAEPETAPPEAESPADR
ncbi:MAG TPA: S1 RNA-binding domain-containing protein [Anaerolineae bacterium]|nr:S1 RNA-binding domain-containing protein [Anaerolineae bacterium]